MVTVATDAFYGGIAGLAVGAGVALIGQDSDHWPRDLMVGAGAGLLVGGAISYVLGVKNTFTMNVEFYTGIDERLEMPMLLPMFRNRLNMEVPPERNCGARVAKHTVVSGT